MRLESWMYGSACWCNPCLCNSFSDVIMLLKRLGGKMLLDDLSSLILYAASSCITLLAREISFTVPRKKLCFYAVFPIVQHICHLMHHRNKATAIFCSFRQLICLKHGRKQETVSSSSHNELLELERCASHCAPPTSQSGNQLLLLWHTVQSHILYCRM